MNYEETINYLFNIAPAFEKVGAMAYKEGLFNTIELDRHFGHPHTKYRTIHVAGTNGKGSCSHSLAAILQNEGYKVGLYTSPHLVDFRERIKVNGQCISKKYVTDFVANERSFFEPLHPSFFELTTALAFKYFKDKEVDIAVIEVGLGGRLDCTNIINPILSIITNISFDHTMFLGDTLEKIATEKAGIIKEKTPIVVGEYVDETKPVFVDFAKKHCAKIIFAEDVSEVQKAIPQSTGIMFHTKHFGDLRGELGGSYQIKNMNTILVAALELISLGIIKQKESIVLGVANVCKLTGLKGRWQCLQKKPLVICDTGHNVGGWKYLSKQIKNQQRNKLRIIFGMVSDKDLNHVMDLMPKDAIYYFTKAETKRAVPEMDIKLLGEKKGLDGDCFGNVAEAYEKAIKDAQFDDFIFIGGSSYVVADLLTYIKSKPHTK